MIADNSLCREVARSRLRTEATLVAERDRLSSPGRRRVQASLPTICLLALCLFLRPEARRSSNSERSRRAIRPRTLRAYGIRLRRESSSRPLPGKTRPGRPVGWRLGSARLGHGQRRDAQRVRGGARGEAAQARELAIDAEPGSRASGAAGRLAAEHGAVIGAVQDAPEATARQYVQPAGSPRSGYGWTGGRRALA